MRLRLWVVPLAICAIGCGALTGAAGAVQQHTQCPPGFISGPVWSPDGAEIFYAFQRGVGYNSEIHALSVSTRVDNYIAGPGQLPQVSPDGRYLLYRRANRLGGEQWAVFLSGSDGSDPHKILTATTGNTAWGPDSRRIAYVQSDNGGPSDILVYDTVTKSSTRLTTSAGNDINPIWSPDGKRLAFASNREGEYLIYTINADGTHERQLTDFQMVCSRTPHWDDTETWLADGSGIVYSRACDGYRVVQIASSTPDASPASDLIDDWTRFRHQSQWPEWSADGTQIIYQIVRNNGYVIRAMNADGSNDRELAQDAWSPHWSPDSQHIVYVSHDAGGLTELYLMEVATGLKTTLTSNPGQGLCLR